MNEQENRETVIDQVTKMREVPRNELPANDEPPSRPPDREAIPDAAEEVQEGNYGKRSYAEPGTDSTKEPSAGAD
ncbi:hypothetical protein [Aridibaculum aurantiacum]|uniref:hypothetical protein n=1 Tax=Aridibaculum aurantiacum TaxID=2810307 RepID=UPI001A96255C|nr:hypothetical protein [Aridibaculum aurantiacum]